MVAACRGERELFDPGVSVKGVDVSRGVGVAAVSSQNNCILMMNDGGVSFPGGGNSKMVRQYLGM